MTLDEAIEVVERHGKTVVTPRDNDKSLTDMWQQVHGLLRMMTDLAEGGARLQLRHPSYFAPTCDYRALTRSAIVGRLDAILDTAVVVREGADDAA